MKNKMVTETILKIELHIVINMFLLKSERNSPKGNICQKRLSERLYIKKIICGGLALTGSWPRRRKTVIPKTQVDQARQRGKAGRWSKRRKTHIPNHPMLHRDANNWVK